MKNEEIDNQHEENILTILKNYAETKMIFQNMLHQLDEINKKIEETYTKLSKTEDSFNEKMRNM